MGTGPSNWHQDYEQNPQVDRENLMVHVFYYMNGLDGTVGDLLVLPGSQKVVMARGAVSDLFQADDLPGSLTFGEGNPVPPGTAVIVHSALLHGRRAKAGGENKMRYFIDASYCQPYGDGRRWPGGDNGHSQGRDLGIGRYPCLFDTSQCY